MNRLADETSPYLRQHADNPVEWWPWGPEAFAEAAERDVPVLLSVGYSACHWCHVMAHESFEDDATAELMNERFVNIKVDREERPDVDAIYMTAVQAMSGRGGWPMTVFMDPEARPFFGGTYFPPTRRHGMPSFTELIESVTDAWVNRRDLLGQQADQLTEAIRANTTISREEIAAGSPVPSPQLLDAAALAMARDFDAEWGGFGSAPKFPASMNLDLLLRIHASEPDSTGDLISMVETSLDAMASGGMYDHLGGGFSRYSVDERWMVPHFEKMLYDNALLAKVYLHSWQVTGNKNHLQVLEETVEYVLRDLRHQDGGFCSAEDADSEGVEGKFYVFTPDEVTEILGDDAPAALEWWGVTAAGNFEGKNIPWRPERGQFVRPASIEAARQKLLAARNKRVRPGLDDKVLTEWNALFLATLAEAALATDNGHWLEAAVANADFLLKNLRDPQSGRWLRSWQQGDGVARARHLGYANDYAALIDGFTRLAEASGKRKYLEAAVQVADGMLELFWDDQDGGLFTNGHDAEELLTKLKDIQDNATPSANSLAALGLLRLGALTGSDLYRERAVEILSLLGPVAARYPTGFGHGLAALDLHHRGPVEVVVVGETPDLVRACASDYRPRVVLAWGEEYDSPIWAHRSNGMGYVCHNFVCEAPTNSPATFEDQLRNA